MFKRSTDESSEKEIASFEHLRKSEMLARVKQSREFELLFSSSIISENWMDRLDWERVCWWMRYLKKIIRPIPTPRIRIVIKTMTMIIVEWFEEDEDEEQLVQPRGHEFSE